jgi:glycosyltransferase involved in cell wall biosynthesis
MPTSDLVSIIIPSRNEKYLSHTIKDVLNKAKGPVEVIAVLDGYWPPYEEIVEHDRVVYIHRGSSRGMRSSINAGVSLAKGPFILKIDAHCLFAEGFDETLKMHCEKNWVIVPRRFALDPETWTVEDNSKYPVDYMYLSQSLHGEIWIEKNRDKTLKNRMIDDLMSAQGSCWFMRKSYYEELELLDEESYGTFYNEFQEIGLKTWLSGGRVVINKNTWYAHWHKSKEDGRGYTLDKDEQRKALEHLSLWQEGKGWHKQIHPLSWLVSQFAPVPTWKEVV